MTHEDRRPGDGPRALGRPIRAAHERELEDFDGARFTASVLARIEVSTLEDEDDEWVLGPEVDPELGGSPIGSWLRAEVDADLAARSEADWAGFRRSLEARLDAETAAEAAEPFPLGRQLREASDRELSAVEDELPRLSAKILEHVEGHPMGMAADLEERAVALLRREVAEEVQALTPAFERRFGTELSRRLAVPPPSLRARLSKWWRQRFDGLGLGLGLAGAAAAAAALLVAVTSLENPTDEPAPEVHAELRGRVSVDSVAFEGDVTMISEEGVTIVVLTGV